MSIRILVSASSNDGLFIYIRNVGSFLFLGCVLHLQELKENDIPLENVRICYSPFSRTTHTAKVVASVLNISFEGDQCKVKPFHPFEEIYFLDVLE